MRVTLSAQLTVLMFGILLVLPSTGRPVKAGDLLGGNKEEIKKFYDTHVSFWLEDKDGRSCILSNDVNLTEFALDKDLFLFLNSDKLDFVELSISKKVNTRLKELKRKPKPKDPDDPNNPREPKPDLPEPYASMNYEQLEKAIEDNLALIKKLNLSSGSAALCDEHGNIIVVSRGPKNITEAYKKGYKDVWAEWELKYSPYNKEAEELIGKGEHAKAIEKLLKVECEGLACSKKRDELFGRLEGILKKAIDDAKKNGESLGKLKSDFKKLPNADKIFNPPAESEKPDEKK